MGKTINMVAPDGTVIPVDEADVQEAIGRDFTVETAEGNAARVAGDVRAEEYGGVVGGVAATGLGLLRSGSGGLSDAGFRALGLEDEVRNLQEAHPLPSLAGELVGSFTGVGGAANKLGQRIAKTAEGATTGQAVGRAALGYGVEGIIQGGAQTISDVSLSAKPINVEHALSSLGSNILFSGGVGAGTGAAFKGLERGLVRAKGYLDDAAKIGDAADGIADDLTTLDKPGLRAAREAEETAIEATRVGQRAELAGEIGTFRRETSEAKLFLATKGIKEDGIGKLGKRTLNADREIDRLLDNPKMLAEKPQFAKAALQKQEAALEEILAKRETLVAKYAGDETATRIAALDAIPDALARNRGLQAKIAELAKKPTSVRLSAIQAADDALIGGTQKAGLGEQIATGAAFSLATGAASMIPGVDAIPGAAPLLGAFAARKAGALLSGRLAKTSAAAAQRTSRAVSSFLDVTNKVAYAAPVLATKVLSEVAYAPPKAPRKNAPKPAKASELATHYKARSEEIRSQVTPGPMGPVMRREARAQMAERLKPVAAMDPVLADRMETLAARRLEFLASKLPKRPDLGVMSTGPDRWQPSDMEMRTFARYAAGVEDPGAIEERLAAGTVTPEDGEVMRQVYPERFAEHQRQIIEGLAGLQEQLPYAKRIALSIYSGIPIDPALNPAILRILQSSFAVEPGTEGGMQAPRAQAQFGSVRSQDATPSQQRQGATS